VFQTYRRYAGNEIYEVEAVQLSKENVDRVSEWCQGHRVLEHDALDHDKTFVGINFPTATGMRRASEGDYILHNIDTTEFYAHSAQNFEIMYEKIPGGGDS
jgi:hypothetical protein